MPGQVKRHRTADLFKIAKESGFRGIVGETYWNMCIGTFRAKWRRAYESERERMRYLPIWQCAAL